MKYLIYLIIPMLIFGCTTSNPVEENTDKFHSDEDPIDLPFVRNIGQQPDSILYYTDIENGNYYVSDSKAIYYSYQTPDKSMLFSERFIGRNDCDIIGIAETRTKVNYFRSNVPENWVNNIPTVQSLFIEDIYDNIDLELEASKNNVEKKFIVHPGGYINEIIISITGVEYLTINQQKELEFISKNNKFKFTRTVAFQIIDGKKKSIEAYYKVVDHQTYSFAVGNYDENHDLIIDPLIASTYLGGSGGLAASHFLHIKNETIYIVGKTSSDDFPMTPNAYQDSLINEIHGDIVIVKLSADLSELLAATYIGASEDYLAYCITTNSAGDIYITGQTFADDFPVTPNAYCTTINSNMADIFVTCLNSDLSELMYSTFLGGSNGDYGYYLLIDSEDNVYVTGHTRSTNFPTTPGAYDETFNTIVNAGDAFISKFDPTLSYLLISTYLGGANKDDGYEMEFNTNGDLYILGDTSSSNFPTTENAYCDEQQGWDDIFISKLDADLSTLYASTLIGGNSRDGWDNNLLSLELSSENNVYVGGTTRSDDFPVTPGVFDDHFNDPISNVYTEGFIFVMNPELSELIASTFAGDSNYDYGRDIVIDEFDNVYLCGWTQNGSNFIHPNAYIPEFPPGAFSQGYIIKLNPTLTTLLAGTFLGGSSGSDPFCAEFINNNICVSAKTNSLDLPTDENSYMPESDGSDWYISILDPDLSQGTAVENHQIASSININIYPNPFSISQGNLKIDFDLREASEVSVEIYNIKGQKVRTIASNSFYPTGRSLLSWDGKDDYGKLISSGMYLCRIAGNRQEYFSKILMIK